MSALTQNSIVLQRVIPSDQSFDKDWYGELIKEISDRRSDSFRHSFAL